MCTFLGNDSVKTLPRQRIHTLIEEVNFSYDRQSVGQSVLVSSAHLGPVINFSFSLKFSLDSCGLVIFVAPSLTRGLVCNLLLLLVLASAVTRDSRLYFIVPILETPNL
jgi:hypothetical protein